MNKIIFIFILGIFASGNLFAQWGNGTGSLSSGDQGDIKWESKIIDIGDIQQYNRQEIIYKLTNVGGKPIIISNAKGSCGCTEIKFSKRPILPGKTTSILVNFDAEDPGVFNKTITLTMNIENSSQVLHLKGTVIR